MAKLKFRNLPESLQRQYGYDTQKAAAYEAERERGLKGIQAKMWADFKIACSATAKHQAENEREMARREKERIRQEQALIWQEHQRGSVSPDGTDATLVYDEADCDQLIAARMDSLYVGRDSNDQPKLPQDAIDSESAAELVEDVVEAISSIEDAEWLNQRIGSKGLFK